MLELRLTVGTVLQLRLTVGTVLQFRLTVGTVLQLRFKIIWIRIRFNLENKYLKNFEEKQVFLHQCLRLLLHLCQQFSEEKKIKGRIRIRVNNNNKYRWYGNC